jgi:protein-S-isoprenylcysteine O-methyltransferase Ste14
VINLAGRAVLGLAQLIGVMGVFLFTPAWTFGYWEAWVYLFVFGASSALITAYLWKKDPQLLQRRINAGPGAEREKNQKLIQLVASVAYICGLVVPSLDHRFSWSAVPLALVVVGDALTVLGFLMVLLVFKENTFTAATIEVAPGQRVISTGPYARIRHPMYSGALVILLGTPLALASWWALVIFILMLVVIAWRALDEERFLSRNLPGYAEYCRMVRYRLVPFVW